MNLFNRAEGSRSGILGRYCRVLGRLFLLKEFHCIREPDAAPDFRREILDEAHVIPVQRIADLENRHGEVMREVLPGNCVRRFQEL